MKLKQRWIKWYYSVWQRFAPEPLLRWWEKRGPVPTPAELEAEFSRIECETGESLPEDLKQALRRTNIERQ